MMAAADEDEAAFNANSRLTRYEEALKLQPVEVQRRNWTRKRHGRADGQNSN